MSKYNKKVLDTNNQSAYANIEPVEAKPLEVKVFNNFEKAMKAFRALVQKERVLSIYKEKQFYEKPSDKKRRKRNEMKRKMMELNSENQPSDKKKSSKDKVDTDKSNG